MYLIFVCASYRQLDPYRLQYSFRVAPREHVKSSEALLGDVHARDGLQLVEEGGHGQHHGAAAARQRL